VIHVIFHALKVFTYILVGSLIHVIFPDPKYFSYNHDDEASNSHIMFVLVVSFCSQCGYLLSLPIFPFSTL
jgi:hypothetical protein